MELWIRSQDKEDLIEVHNIGLAYKGKYGFMDKIGDIDGYCICEFINDYHVKLGTYKTKERALEVLDDIQNIIIGKYMTNLSFEASFSKFDDEEEARKTLIAMAVYEMPKE